MPGALLDHGFELGRAQQQDSAVWRSDVDLEGILGGKISD
jgi:hypothetical protein